MSIIGAVASTAFIGWILIEAFEAMVLPRRVMRKLRFNRWSYSLNWPVWLLISRAFRSPKRSETFLSAFGPLSFQEDLTTDNTDNTTKRSEKAVFFFFYSCYPCHPWLTILGDEHFD